MIIELAKSLLSYAKDAAVNANLLEPVYGLINTPVIKTICKPAIKAVVDCAFWGWWCTQSEVETGGQSCRAIQTIEPVPAIVDYQMDSNTAAMLIGTAAATTIAVVAAGGCLYKWCTDKKKDQPDEQTHENPNGRAPASLAYN